MAGNILRMAIPMTIAQMVNVLYSVVDRFFIGHIDGASSMALTGVGIVFPIISVITAFTNLFGMGGAQPVLGYNYGAGEYRRVKSGDPLYDGGMPGVYAGGLGTGFCLPP